MKTLFNARMLPIAVCSLLAFQSFSQEKDNDTIQANQLQEVLLKATRVKDKSPFAFSNITKEKLESTNLGQDLPVLLDQLPSVVTTSDAGAGVGYTGIRVRGSDATRVNVTINGIPYNDAESQGTFWVNMPDFVSSVEDIQLQRGVGTSTNGSAAFGASLNLKTIKPAIGGYATISNSIGSFGTQKHTLSLGSGIKKGFYAEGRLSKIDSDGYIDRAFSDLSSFYTEAGFLNDKTAVKVLVFGGKEKTYQSWYGTPEAVLNGDAQGIQDFIDRNYLDAEEAQNLLTSGRTYNHYTYKNETDNYEQNHFQLHFSHQVNESISFSISGNYTPGEGYYEQYKKDEKIGDYFPASPDADLEGNVIRRKWLDNNFYAVVYSLNIRKNKLDFSFGGGFNEYRGDSFGTIIWNSFPTEIPIDTRYYQSFGDKKEYSFYAKAQYKMTKKWLGYLDLQYRNVNHKINGLTSDMKNVAVAETYSFFNPKAGLTFLMNDKSSFYASVAVANREPNRDDLTKNALQPKAEQLIDFELGHKYKGKRFYINSNFYWMNYNNQLVLTGDIDDVGDPIRQNVSKSYRAGIEIVSGYAFFEKLKWEVNATVSQNKIKDFKYIVYDTQYDPDTYETVSYTPLITQYKDTDISFSPALTAGSSLVFSPVRNVAIGLHSKYVGKQYLDNTSGNNKKMDAYFINNLNVSYKISPKWIKEIAFNLLVNNIFDEKYVSNGYTYSYYYRPVGSNDDLIKENFYYPQAGINFLTGVTLKF
jgi:iron complex outermembrane receptor protein